MSRKTPSRHECLIFDGSPSRMLPAIATTIRRRLEAGMRCMYMNSPAMVAGLRSQLYAVGTDVVRECASGSLICTADNSHFVEGRFDVDRMIDMLDAAVDLAISDGYAGLFVTGDMTWEFGAESEFLKLLEYEWRLEQLLQKQPGLSGICQYHRDLLPERAVREGFLSHRSLFISETISRLNPHYVLARSPEQRMAAVTAGLDDALAALIAVEESSPQ